MPKCRGAETPTRKFSQNRRRSGPKTLSVFSYFSPSFPIKGKRTIKMQSKLSCPCAPERGSLLHHRRHAGRFLIIRSRKAPETVGDFDKAALSRPVPRAGWRMSFRAVVLSPELSARAAESEISLLKKAVSNNIQPIKHALGPR